MKKINKNVIWIKRHLDELISAYLMTLASVCKSFWQQLRIYP